MCGPSSSKLARAHPCALLGPACSTFHTWSSFILPAGDSSSPRGCSVLPGAFGAARAWLKDGALQKTLGFCAFRNTQRKGCSGFLKGGSEPGSWEQEQTETWCLKRGHLCVYSTLAWLSGLHQP